MKIGIVVFCITLIIYFSNAAHANEVSILCVDVFDGRVSVREKDCETDLKDKNYAKKQRHKLYRNYPHCDSNKNHVIDGGNEKNCVKSIKSEEYNELQKQCDGIDRKGKIHPGKRNGKINGYSEKKCIRTIKLAKDEETIAKSKENIAKDKEHIRALKKKEIEDIKKLKSLVK